ncbi:LysR family transcriptional regulator [Pontibacterium sp. N1Y112]|uniref:LysR family transcriptional regulator n=1 Tax=Pontibacterium sinense TaxID=2781979 RepID=A0A8J7FBE8_9GAMM|nr:LysR family transcriptional regulator [Pontibacterium sinense]MBE9396609.1 LysR family transcriptional regulator [Pontibacterium sinense]
MDKLSEMQVFVAAVRSGSFSAAGRQLELSPSAVSKLISRMESRLGVRLLNRTTRTLSLTEGGQVYFQRCLEIIHDVESAEDALSGFGQVPKGTLRINSSAGFARHQLIPQLSEFQMTYPEIDIELQLSGLSVDLIGERVDVAIRLGSLEDTSLVARKLGESQRIVCASPTYLEKYGQPQTPDELKQHQCLRLSTSDSFNHWHFNRQGVSEVIDIDRGFVTDNVEALHEYARMGGGIARLSSFMVAGDIEAGRLIPLLRHYDIDKQQIHVLYTHRKYLPAKIRVFVDFLLQKFVPTAPWT